MNEEIKFVARISHIEEKKQRHYVSGTGSSAVFREESLGWWVIFEGWPASMRISEHANPKPNFEVGDNVELRLRKKP